jgi:SWI/SNF-related matrix-associated actin-dependent regulator 1 of chromatin subfamily A
MKSSNDFTFDIKSELNWIIGNSLQDKFLALKSLNFDMGLCIDDELLKSDRPGPHLYIRKYQKGNRTVYVYDDAGKEKHRYDDDGKIDSLMEMGSHLDGIDLVQERNDAGFNKIDKQRWSYLAWELRNLTPEQRKTYIPQLKSILKKYKRQLSNAFGAEQYEHTGLSDATMHIVDPVRHPRWQTIQLPLKSDGRLGKEQFNKYLALQREFGLKGARDENGGFVWFIPRESEAGFDWNKYGNKLHEIGIQLESAPEPMPESPAGSPAPASSPTSRPAPAPESVDQVIEAIKNRRANKVLAIRRDPDGKFSIFHPYDPEVVNFFSNRGGEISGIMEYNPNQKSRETHELELVQEVMEKFKEKFPEWRVVTGGVDEAIREEERRQAELRLPIPHVSAKMNPEFKLFPYQNEAVRFLEKANGNALIGDEMGLGKTLQSLAYVAGNNKRVLVVVPKVVRRTWVQEAEKFFPDYFKGKSKELIPAELAKNGMPDLTGVNIATVNYESLEKFMPAIQAAGFDTIVVDESHRIKSPTAKITKTITRMAPLFAHKILLSGTAVKNKKEELFTQMEIIRPNLFSKDELKRGTIGGVWNKLKRTGAYISRQKRKVLADLPEKTTQIAEVPVTGMPAFPRDIGEMSAAKVKAALAKVPATHDFVNEILESSDSSVLLFTESVEAAQKLKELFGDVAILHHGQMSDEKREQAKAEFQNPDSPKRVFISTRQSLAVGATLTRADKVVFNDLPWTAADVRQAEDRAHRVGQRNNVNVYWMTAQGNDWDTNLSAIVKKKYELNRKLNEGKQLTREEREWMEKPVSLEDIRAEMTGHSPMEKSFSIFDLMKAVAGHKYIRKYMARGKWIYVYHEGQKRHEISPEKVELIRRLADLGDESAREMIQSLDSAKEAPSKKEAHAPEGSVMTFKEPERSGSKTRSVEQVLSGMQVSGYGQMIGRISDVAYQSPSTSTCNLVGFVAFGRANKTMQKKLNERVQICELVLSEMGVRFKTPLDFVCGRMNDDQIGGTYASYSVFGSGSYANTWNPRIRIFKRFTESNKSLLHEIGHAIDYAMASGSSPISLEAITGTLQGEARLLLQELRDVVQSSEYYKEPQREDYSSIESYYNAHELHFKYLRNSSEVFARAFEVYSYSVVKKMVEEGKIDKSFLKDFKPDIFKKKSERWTELNRAAKTEKERLLELESEYHRLIMRAQTATSLRLLRESANELEENKAKLREQETVLSNIASQIRSLVGQQENGQTLDQEMVVLIPEEKQKEYMEKISSIMTRFLQTNEFKKAVEMFFIKSDKIRGGKADDKKPSDFDKKKLAEGMKVEREHTSDKKIAQEIAMDHLTEDPNYYVKLKEVEKGKEPPTLGEKEGRVPVMRNHEGRPSGKPAPSAPPSTLSMHKSDKPFHGYNKKRHSPTGGLNAKFRAKYNREHGSNLQAPVTEKKPTGKRAARRRSFCARMSGVRGPTSKDGKLTPKGAALKRWRCSEVYVIDLVKAMLGQSVAGHKYLRKYMRNNQWVYVYHEAGQHGRVIPEQVVKHLKRLADAGDQKAKDLYESLQAHDEAKLAILRQLADRGEEQAHNQLKQFGIDREKERVEEAVLRKPKDPIDEEKPEEWQRNAIGEVIAEIQAARNHLRQYQDSPIGQAIWSTLSDENLTNELKESKNIRQLMDNLEKIARKLEEKQGDVSAQRPSNHLTYGNMIYNESLNRLVRADLIPREYAEVHKRQARSTDHKTSTMAGIQDRIRKREEREQRERAEREERERRERAEREERERRELGEIHGSMAHHMSNLMQRPLNISDILKLNRTLKEIFGKDLRAEDWPYQFPEGTTMKITDLQFDSSTSLVLHMQIYNSNGERIMEGWKRTWSVEGGRPKIYNSYMSVLPSARNTIQVGEYINSGQRRLLRSCPNGGIIKVSAALDVGAYNWANQGFSFSSGGALDSYRDEFQAFARARGVNLSDEDMQKFTAPVHFAAFRDGKKYVRETAVESKLSEQQIRTGSLSGVEGEFPLSPEEIRSRKTKRMLCHLGKHFMLGKGWNGVWDSRKDTPESRYAESYRQMREQAVKHLQQEYRELLERVELNPSSPTPRAPITVDSDPNQVSPPEVTPPRLSENSRSSPVSSGDPVLPWVVHAGALTQAGFTFSDTSALRPSDIYPQVGVYRRVSDYRGDPRYHRIFSQDGRYRLETRTDTGIEDVGVRDYYFFNTLPDAIARSNDLARRAQGAQSYRDRVASRQTTNEYGVVSSHVENTLRGWAGGVNLDGQYARTIRMTAGRMSRIRLWPLANLKYFRDYAPLSADARRQVTELMRERAG